MAVKITALIFGVLALVLTYRTEWVLKNVFRREEPDSREILRLKYAALGIAIAAFLIVMLSGRG